MRIFLKFASIFSFGVFLFMVGCMAPSSTKSSAAMNEIGESQLFSLKNVEGEEVSLGDLLKNNKAVLINFWATWCPPCREEIPGLIETQTKYKDRSFTVLGIDVGESEVKVSNFIEKMGINYPVVLDSDSRVAESYGVVGIPTSLLISSEGKILGKYHAYTQQLVDDIEKALQ